MTRLRRKQNRLGVMLGESLLTFGLLVLATGAFAAEEPRTITVSGNGSARIAPDRATVMMSIVAKDPKLGNAQQAAAAVTAKVLQMTDDLGIARTEIDTTGSTVRPDYRWDREREEQELIGYVAERHIRIDVRDLDKLGMLIEKAVELGVNQVSPPQLDSSKRRDGYRDALDAAARDARANATRLAQSLGASIGSVLQVTTVSQPAPPMPYMRMAADSMEMSAPETYNAASLDFEATITAVFELLE